MLITSVLRESERGLWPPSLRLAPHTRVSSLYTYIGHVPGLCFHSLQGRNLAGFNLTSIWKWRPQTGGFSPPSEGFSQVLQFLLLEAGKVWRSWPIFPTRVSHWQIRFGILLWPEKVILRTLLSHGCAFVCKQNVSKWKKSQEPKTFLFN